jgi:hypothetical protein
MGIISEKIKGKKIINEIKSSTIKKTEYDTSSSVLLVTFNNDTEYEYTGVPHELYTKFRMSESQGSFFSKEISKKYPYKKITK